MRHLLVVIQIILVTAGFSQRANPYNLPLVGTKDAYRESVVKNNDFRMVDLGEAIPGVVLDIRYATPNNFTGRIVYTEPKAFLRKPVAEALAKVQDSLNTSGIGLKIYDAYRPYAATLKFYEVYPDTAFVAPPRTGSRHNRGCAVDVTLVDLKTGSELEMPTPFDDFSAKSAPRYTALPDSIKTRRDMLIGVMSAFGFSVNPNEWWHFDYRGWENYPLMDLSFSELIQP